jgi:hypothetical protein
MQMGVVHALFFNKKKWTVKERVYIVGKCCHCVLCIACIGHKAKTLDGAFSRLLEVDAPTDAPWHVASRISVNFITKELGTV